MKIWLLLSLTLILPVAGSANVYTQLGKSVVEATLTHSTTLPPARQTQLSNTQSNAYHAKVIALIKNLNSSDLPVQQRMLYFADPVDYFDQGQLTRQQVGAAIRAFEKKWPQREYQIVDIQPYHINQNTLSVSVTYTMTYRLVNSHERQQGKVDQTVLIRNIGLGDPQIHEIRQTLRLF